VNCVRNTNWTCSGGSPTTADVCTPLCGNVRNGAEACDDGNPNNGDGCSSSCTIETGFNCVLGALNTATMCTPICNDGKRVQGEVCDDSNFAVLNHGGVGCIACASVSQYWSCTGGTTTTPDVCNPSCGNVRNGNEQCDDGNPTSGDGCESNCVETVGFDCTGALNAASVCLPICGDGLKQTLESCDVAVASPGCIGCIE
jgi:cysteine-rich repeat protein